MTTTSGDDYPVALIRAQLGGRRKPEIIWYVAPSEVNKFPLDTIEALMWEPKLLASVERLQNGGLLFIIFASQAPIENIETMLCALGTLYNIPVSEVI